uniref:Uncharacterized protein n=1 Tax=Plectus sambesii TaxID=2011161 RepID=A0A914WUG5_9BILA
MNCLLVLSSLVLACEMFPLNLKNNEDLSAGQLHRLSALGSIPAVPESDIIVSDFNNYKNELEGRATGSTERRVRQSRDAYQVSTNKPPFDEYDGSSSTESPFDVYRYIKLALF